MHACLFFYDYLVDDLPGPFPIGQVSMKMVLALQENLLVPEDLMALFLALPFG